ncbi:lipid IV(A) palmitoyltransferase PagP [Pandoraea nosoerga]|uniref:Phospholipid:lipid A palmitoyltransferase n=1 Tax=Pandoraea nosoerga TaxID=2508296 RepID=A0A5E4VW77_9BURK|nr:lipid IV(A) palmitoyltransferase PagP [Pandoraea nosoerga]VVE16648.1 phospholipid:lipid A palmitoyltransferase [Pandoraea nosoerga]
MPTTPQNNGRLASSIHLASAAPLSRASQRCRHLAWCAVLSSLTPFTAQANDAPSGISTWTGAIVDEVREVATQGASDLYVPLHTHHLRFAYTRDKISQYNENPWGLGYGRVLSDGKNGSRMLYAMAFKDSHNDWSPMAGYGRIWNVANAGPVRFGLGYTVFLMSRSDTLGGVPFPGALPLAQIGVGRAYVATAYVPGGKGNGNVLFIFGRYTFGKPG